ncbi:MAG: hypothetical protein H8E47_01260 [Anaerolineales bacterium]|nr:hypothetical protein [Anaerolineales bacterium]
MLSSHLHGHTVTKAIATFAAHPPVIVTGFERTGRTPALAADPLHVRLKRGALGGY